MKSQIVQFPCCRYCNYVLNHNEDRGNGRTRRNCNIECERKYYLFRKRLNNLENQFAIARKHNIVSEELTDTLYEFVKCSQKYLDNNLPMIYLVQHFEAVSMGNASTVPKVFAHQIKQKDRA